MERLWIVGAGGHGAEVLNTLRHVVAAGKHELLFADAHPQHDAFLGVPLCHQDQVGSGDSFVVAIGSGRTRERVEAELVCCGARPFFLQAPTAIVGQSVYLADGAALSDFTILTANVRVGRQFQCNMHGYVAHDCVIGDYVTFAPRVSCNGNIHIGDHAYIGTGAVLRQGTPDKPLRIGAGATVGMGAVVTKDVPPGATVVGNPARRMVR